MPNTNVSTTVADSLTLETVAPSKAIPSLLEDVEKGLFCRPLTLPSKYFYDDIGSQLFDQICDTPEYYPTRTEDALLAHCASDLINAVRPDRIIELGSGAARKTRHLLQACTELEIYPSYAPFDVCQEIMVDSGAELVDRYHWLEVNALVGDYMAGFGNIPISKLRNLFVFLGGTIGNFRFDEAQRFLKELRDFMGPDDRLLLGADRVKDPDVLHRAYNDASGLTAAFNLNVLKVINRRLDADFDVDNFEHYACFNPGKSRIEMHLLSMCDQRVEFSALNEILELKEGESILTEVSCKYTYERLEGLFAAAGFSIEHHYEPDNSAFSLVVARPD